MSAVIALPDLERLTRTVCDVVSLVNLAAELAERADRDADMGAVTRVGALLRALRLQAGELHRMTDAQWMDACRAELRKEGGAA